MIKLLDIALSAALIFLMGLMVLDVTWQVVSRFLLDDPSSWSEELARFLLIWVGLLGAAWAFRQKAHLGLSYVVEKLHPANQTRLYILSMFACILFAAAVMVYGGWQLVQLSLELKQVSAALGIRMGYVYLVTPITGVLIIIYSLYFIIQTRSQERS